MKKLLSLVILLSFATLVQAQKIINDPNVVKRTVGSFHGINVGTGIKLVMSEGAAEEVAVSSNKPEYRDKIVTEVENGILKIYYENKLKAINTAKEKKELRAYVTYKSLDELNANTGAIVQVEGILRAGSFKLKANTGSIVKGAVDVDVLSVDANTGAVVTLAGEAGKFSFDGDLGAVFNGAELKTNSCEVSASTGSGVYITVQKELSVKASTGGFVKYKGNADTKNIKTSTGASVSKL